MNMQETYINQEDRMVGEHLQFGKTFFRHCSSIYHNDTIPVQSSRRQICDRIYISLKCNFSLYSYLFIFFRCTRFKLSFEKSRKEWLSFFFAKLFFQCQNRKSERTIAPLYVQTADRCIHDNTVLRR